MTLTAHSSVYNLPVDLIKEYADKFKINKTWLTALILKESKGVEHITRYEPHFDNLWFYRNTAEKLNITWETEKVHQKTSWGIMQIMGATAREMGFSDHLPKLATNELSLEYGCKYLKRKLEKYGEYRLAVAAYNYGHVKYKEKSDTILMNQRYVDDVFGYYVGIKDINERK